MRIFLVQKLSGLVALGTLVLAFSASPILADDGSGCSSAGPSYVVTDSCDTGCGVRPGHTSIIARLRNRMSCNPAMQQGLWDGYCEERQACATPSCNTGGGVLPGLGGCGKSLACGCGSQAFGLPGPISCDSDCGSGCGGCSGIFGTPRSSCFRNDGHFFSGFSRHGHGCRQSERDCSSGCKLFGGRRSTGCNSLSRGHCQNGGEMESYGCDCGSAIAIAPSCDCH